MTVEDTTSVERTRTYPLDTASTASAAAISPNGARTAVAAGGTIAMLRPKLPGGRYTSPDPGGLVADAFTGLSTTVTALTFTGGSRRLVSAAGDALALWDPAQRSRLARRLPVRVPDLYDLLEPPGLATSGDGRRVASGGEDGRITISDGATGRRTGSISPGSDVRPTVGVLLDGRGQIATVLSAAPSSKVDEVLQLDVAHGTRRGSLAIEGSGAAPSEAALLAGPGGQPLLVRDDGSVSRLDLRGGRVDVLADAIPGRDSEDFVFASDVAVVRARRELYEASGSRIWSVDLQTGRRTAWNGPPGEKIASLAASADGRIVATTDGQSTVHVWDVASRRVTRTLDTGPVTSLELSDDASHLAAVQGDGTVGVWRPMEGTKLGGLPLGDPQTGIAQRGISAQTRVRFGPDGTLWTATTGFGLYAWSMSPATWTRAACATIGRSLTRDEWQRYLGIAYKPRSPC